jgi:hypothetical protein
MRALSEPAPVRDNAEQVANPSHAQGAGVGWLVSDEIKLWLWTIPDELTGKRRQTRYRMTEEEARERFGDHAQKVVEGTAEVREPNQGTNFRGPQ